MSEVGKEQMESVERAWVGYRNAMHIIICVLQKPIQE